MIGNPLINALRWGRSNKAIEFIERGQYLNQVANNGLMPLHIAARNGLPAVVSALIKAKADVHALNGYNPPNTPLISALLGCRPDPKFDICHQLIAAGADVNGKYPKFNKLTNEIEWIYPKENMPHALYFAVKPVQFDAPFDRALISLFIESGADLERECTFCDRTETSIIAAARENKMEAVRLLVSYGADCKKVLTQFPNRPEVAQVVTTSLTFRYQAIQEALKPYLADDLIDLLGYIEKPTEVVAPKI